MMENNYVFIKKHISDTQAEQKEACYCNICIARNKEFQLIWQKPYSRQPQVPFSMKKVDLDES